MRPPNIRSFLGRHTVAAQAGMALVAATGLAWSNAGLALADLSLPESLPVTCASGSVADASTVSDDADDDTEEVGDDHHHCFPNDGADQRVGWNKWHGDDSKLRPHHRHSGHRQNH